MVFSFLGVKRGSTLFTVYFFCVQDTTADLNTTFTLPKTSKSWSMVQQRPPSSKQLFSKEGSRSPPPHRPPTGRRQLAPLSESEKRRSPPPFRSPNSSETSLFQHDLRDMVPPPSRGGPLPPPIPPPGVKFSRRHQSLPSSVANRDLPTRGQQQHKATNLGNGSPRLSPIGSPANSRRNVALDEVRSDCLPPAMPPELAESWPRSRARARGKAGPAGTSAPVGHAEMITPDPLKAVGAGNTFPTLLLTFDLIL